MASYQEKVDLLDALLRALAAHMSEHGAVKHNLSSYGADYRNDTFQMHTYCWCEQNDCPWCAFAEVSADGIHYINGEEVTPQEWKNFMETLREFGAEDGKSAPNFWHFQSGLKVWWYKHIGRGTEVNKALPLDELIRIVLDCMESVKADDK